MQIQALAQRHVDGNVGRRAAREKGRDRAFAQAGEDQRVRIAAHGQKDDEGIHHQRDQQHAAHQHQQQPAIAGQRAQARLGQCAGHQAKNTQRGKTDHHPDDLGHRLRQVQQRRARGLAGMPERDAQPDGPGQDADEIRLGQRLERIGDGAEQQVVQHSQNVARGRAGDGGRVEHQRGGKGKAGEHGHHRCTQRADQVKHQDGPDVRGLSTLVAGDGRRHQHKHQHGRHGLQRGNEQVAQHGDRARCSRRQQRQRDAADQADDNLAYQRHV